MTTFATHRNRYKLGLLALLVPLTLWLLLTGLFATGSAHALNQNDTKFVIPQIPVLTVSQTANPQLDLAQYTSIYNPGQQKLTIANLTELHNSHWKKIADISPLALLEPRHSIWYRITLFNDSREEKTVVLRDRSVVIDTLSAYLCQQPDNASLCRATEAWAHHRNATRFLLAPQQTTTLYINTYGFHSAFFTLSLLPPATYAVQQHQDKLFISILDGMLLGMTLYMLTLGIKTRQRYHYAFYLYGTAMLFQFFIQQSFWYSIIGTMPGHWLSKMVIAAPLLTNACQAFFIQAYADVQKKHKHLHAYLNFLIAFNLVMAAAFLLNAPTIILLPVFILACACTTPILIYLCVVVRRQPHVNMPLLALGIFLPILSGNLFLMELLGEIKPLYRHLEVMESIDIAQLTIFAAALLSSIRQLQTEHEEQTIAASEADIVSQAHNRLLAHLNHELRTPLNGILGAAEILVQKAHPKDRYIFSMIHHTALPLKHLIDDMINVNSITDNQNVLQEVRFDLHSLLQECMDVFLPTAHNKQIRLFFHIDHEVTTDITTDANRLRQILLNLIGNACKFTHHGDVGVHVRQESSVNNHEHIYYFEVIDSGQGISQADEQRLFGIFETGGTTSENPKGVGLGLSIVRDLSKMLGGHCGYQKNATAGSTFWFSIKAIAHQKIARTTHKALENLTILLADESRALCEHLAKQVAGSTKVIAAHTTQQLDAFLDTIETDDAAKLPALALLHNHLATDEIVKPLMAAGIFVITYTDQSDAITPAQHANGASVSLIRKSSIDAFILQVADIIIKKSTILQRSLSAEQRGDELSLNTLSMPLKILAAEDTPTSQLIIEEMIIALHHQVVLCHNGKHAYETFVRHHHQHQPFDVIIMDCEMPLQDGFETTSQIRQYEAAHRVRRVPIIALSAHTETTYRQRSELAGMDAYLTKPITTAVLQQCLADIRRKSI